MGGMASVAPTPHPNPPPQWGREQIKADAYIGRHTPCHIFSTNSYCNGERILLWAGHPPSDPLREPAKTVPRLMH